LSSWILLISHLGSIFLAPFLLIDFSDAMDVILIMCPLTGAFVLIVVQHYAEAFEADRGPQALVDPNAALITVFLCVVLGLSVIGVQVLYWSGRIPDIDTLKRSVGMIDTVIGGYTAILIKRLFATHYVARPRRPKAS
jgi:hypothetical protein